MACTNRKTVSEGEGGGGQKRSRWTKPWLEAHTSLAFIKFRWDRDRVEAEREFQLAIKYKPTYARRISGTAPTWLRLSV